MRKVQVGIDLGTTNTLACCRVRGKMKLVRFRGGTMLPSVMYVEKQEDGSIKEIVGKAAKIKGLQDPDNYISSSKTYIGLTGANKKTWNCYNREYTPTDVAEKILEEVHKKVRDMYELEKDDIVQAVITIPAYFTSTQSDETKRAGERAGMEILRIITEPVAAALAAAEDINGKIFVVDLGGGTFDVSVLDIGEKYTTLEIGGERKLGGDDFDDMLVNYFLKYIEADLMIDLSTLETSGLDYNNYYIMMSKIRKAAVEMKEELSDSEEYEVDIPALFEYGNNKQYSFSMTLTRDEFNDICRPLFERIIKVIDDVVNKSRKFKIEELKKIFLVGGSCYIPKIQADVEQYFGITTDSEQDRATLVAMGAGKIADAWDGFTDDKDRIDPFDDTLEDIVSHNMGIEILGNNNKREFSCILPKGTVYPCKVMKDYTTIYDYQDSVVVKVYEKTDNDATDFLDEDQDSYDLYGSFELLGITPAPAGETMIKVTFDYDKSRTLNVTAEDAKNGISQTVELHKGEMIDNSVNEAMDLVLLLDVSGSMRGERINAAKEACYKLVKETLDLSIHRLSFITFGDYAKIMCPLTNDEHELIMAIDRVEVRGSTNMSDGINMAQGILKDSISKKAIILVTDGEPMNGKAVEKAAEIARKAKILIATIGVQEANIELLRRLTTDKELNFEINDLDKISDTFGKAVNNLLRKK